MRMKKMEFNIIIPAIVLTIGILFLLLAGTKAIKQMSFVKNATSTVGVINGFDYSTSNRIQRENDSESGFAGNVDVSMAMPKVEFNIGTGELVSVIAKTSVETKSGEEVRILYLPSDHNSMQFNEFFLLWGLIIILACFGAIFCLVAVALRFLI